MNNRGIALILALLVLLLLSVMALEFSFSMRLEVDTAKNFKDEINGYFHAQSGFQQAVAKLIKQQTFRKSSTTPVTELPTEPEFEEEEEIAWRDDQRKIAMDFGSGKAEVIISNEKGKFDINVIPESLLR